MTLRRSIALLGFIFLALPPSSVGQSEHGAFDTLSRPEGCQSSTPLPDAKVLRPCYDTPPQAVNRGRMTALQDSLYTDDMKVAAIGGRATVSVFLDREGMVRLGCVASSSGYGRLDDIALTLLSVARFNPAMRDGAPVPTWHTELISFSFRTLAPPEGIPSGDRVRPMPPCPRVVQESP